MVKVAPGSVLVIIDVQKGFSDPRWGVRNNPDAEKRMEKVLGEFRKLYCLSQFWTDRKNNYDTVPAVSPPFLLVIFASLLKTLAFSIFASLMASRTSGFPL